MKKLVREYSKGMFCKKHYEVMADEVRRNTTSEDVYTKEFIISLLAGVFQFDSAKFDRERFIKACGE